MTDKRQKATKGPTKVKCKREESLNLLFFAVLVAVVVAEAPCCCHPEILPHCNVTSHFSSQRVTLPDICPFES